jgi:hypothetical protein
MPCLFSESKAWIAPGACPVLRCESEELSSANENDSYESHDDSSSINGRRIPPNRRRRLLLLLQQQNKNEERTVAGGELIAGMSKEWQLKPNF